MKRSTASPTRKWVLLGLADTPTRSVANRLGRCAWTRHQTLSTDSGARGFLAEAEEDLCSSRWRSCVDDAQLAVENAAKSVIARFGPVPRTHDMSAVLSEHLRLGAVPPELR